MFDEFEDREKGMEVLKVRGLQQKRSEDLYRGMRRPREYDIFVSARRWYPYGGNI